MKTKFDPRKRRHELGMTILQVADKAGVSPSYIQQLETKAIRCPSFMTLHKIADALGIPVRYLLSEEENAVFLEAMRHGARDEREAKRKRTQSAVAAATK